MGYSKSYKKRMLEDIDLIQKMNKKTLKELSIYYNISQYVIQKEATKQIQESLIKGGTNYDETKDYKIACHGDWMDSYERKYLKSLSLKID